MEERASVRPHTSSHSPHTLPTLQPAALLHLSQQTPLRRAAGGGYNDSGEVTSVCWSKAGFHLVSAASDCSVVRWDVQQVRFRVVPAQARVWVFDVGFPSARCTTPDFDRRDGNACGGASLLTRVSFRLHFIPRANRKLRVFVERKLWEYARCSHAC